MGRNTFRLKDININCDFIKFYMFSLEFSFVCTMLVVPNMRKWKDSELLGHYTHKIILLPRCICFAEHIWLFEREYYIV